MYPGVQATMINYIPNAYFLGSIFSSFSGRYLRRLDTDERQLTTKEENFPDSQSPIPIVIVANLEYQN